MTVWETMSAPQRQWVMQMMGMMPQQAPGMPQPGMPQLGMPGTMQLGQMPGMMGQPGMAPGAVPGTTNPLVNQLSGGGVGTMNPYMRQLLMQYMQQPPGGGGMGLQQPPMGNP
jgi:hypothetical protein